MIPCYVCGKDASTGWTKGFVPAPDSQKLALCPEHNTPDNRLAVVNAWHTLLEREAAIMTGIAEFRAAAPSLQTATVHFTGGGMLSFTCLSCSPTEQGTLCIESPDGARNFIPMQHIREYSVRPYAADTAGEAPGEAARAEQLSFPPTSLHSAALAEPGEKHEEPLSFHAHVPPRPALPEEADIPGATPESTDAMRENAALEATIAAPTHPAPPEYHDTDLPEHAVRTGSHEAAHPEAPAYPEQDENLPAVPPVADA